MKTLTITALTCLLTVCAAATTTVTAQESPAKLPDAPGVSVLQMKWRREVRNPALDDDPFSAGREASQIQQEKRETIKSNVINKQLGRDPEPLPNRQAPQISSEGPKPMYVYEVKIMNTGTKTIRALNWEYVFFDPDTHLEVGRHRYRSGVSLRAGKSGKLDGVSGSPQTGVVNVAKTGQPLQGQYAERIEINRIEYADGTHWQRDSK